jgi:membrane protein
MNLARGAQLSRPPSRFAQRRVISRATSLPSVAAESLWKLGGLTPWQLGRAVLEEITANNVLGRAAELAFYFLFALFPLIFLMMTLFGLFASHNGELQTDLLSYFADFLPPTASQLLGRVTGVRLNFLRAL